MILEFYNLYVRLQVSKPWVKLNYWGFTVLENPCCTICSELLFLPIHSRKLRTGSHHRMGESCAGQPPLSKLEKITSHLKNKNQICLVTSAFSYGSFGVDHRDHSASEGQQGKMGLWRGLAGAIFKNKRFNHIKQCSKEQGSRIRSLLIKLQISPNNHIFPWACIQQPFCKIFRE